MRCSGVAGAPAALVLRGDVKDWSPPPRLSSYGRTREDPFLDVVSADGAVVAIPTGAEVVVTLSLIPGATVTPAEVRINSSTPRPVPIQPRVVAYADSRYRLTFSAVLLPAGGGAPVPLQGAEFGLATALCPPTTYAVPALLLSSLHPITSTPTAASVAALTAAGAASPPFPAGPDCRPCPSGGVCDGSAAVAVLPGWWRRGAWPPPVDVRVRPPQGVAAGEYQLTRLAAMRLCPTYSLGADTPQLAVETSTVVQCRRTGLTPGDARCLGGHGSRCGAGYGGPLCAKCGVGYGLDKGDCLPCPSQSFAVAGVLGFTAVVVAIYALVAALALSDNTLYGKHGAEQRYVSVVAKLLMNHLHMVAVLLTLPLRWNSALIWIGSIAQSVSIFDLTLRSVSCLFAPSYFTRVYVYVVVPVAVTAVVAVVLGVVKFVRRQRGGLFLFTEPFVTVIVVVMFLLYPNILVSVVSLFRCRNLGGLAVVDDDVDVVCSSPAHRAVQALGGVAVVVYVAVLPMCAELYLAYHRARGTERMRSALNTVGFLYRGYRPEMWFWESVVHVRKVLIFTIVALSVDEAAAAQQALGCLLVLAAQLVINLWADPYLLPSVQFFENVSISVLFITLVLGVMHTTLVANNAASLAITVFTFLILAVGLLLFVAMAFVKLRDWVMMVVLGVDDTEPFTLWDTIRAFTSRIHPRAAPPTPSYSGHSSDDGDEMPPAEPPRLHPDADPPPAVADAPSAEPPPTGQPPPPPPPIARQSSRRESLGGGSGSRSTLTSGRGGRERKDAHHGYDFPPPGTPVVESVAVHLPGAIHPTAPAPSLPRVGSRVVSQPQQGPGSDASSPSTVRGGTGVLSSGGGREEEGGAAPARPLSVPRSATIASVAAAQSEACTSAATHDDSAPESSAALPTLATPSPLPQV